MAEGYQLGYMAEGYQLGYMAEGYQLGYMAEGYQLGYMTREAAVVYQIGVLVCWLVHKKLLITSLQKNKDRGHRKRHIETPQACKGFYPGNFFLISKPYEYGVIDLSAIKSVRIQSSSFRGCRR